MTEHDKNEIDLDVFFEDIKQPAPELSASLMATILGDAAEVSATRQPSPPASSRKGSSWFANWLSPLGGIPAMATVSLCAALGVTVGYAGTDSLQSIPGVGGIVASISGDPLDDFTYNALSDFNDFLSEG